MPAYVVGMMTVDDPETYGRYTDRTPAIIRKHGGKFLTRGGPVSCLEGENYTGRMQYRHAASTIHYLMVQEGGDGSEAPGPIL